MRILFEEWDLFEDSIPTEKVFDWIWSVRHRG